MKPSPLLTTVSRLTLPLGLLFAFHILLRGHNLPGGGFIAGLLTAAVIGLQYTTFGLEWIDKRLPLRFESFLILGLSLALATGLGSFLFSQPFLTSWVGHAHDLPFLGELEFATALLFDLGVYFTVVGVTVGVFHVLGEEKPWK